MCEYWRGVGVKVLEGCGCESTGGVWVCEYWRGVGV